MEIKTVTFRPLRRIKKTNKIVVASYPQWYRIKTADYSKFNLVISNDHKMLPLDEYVYDHEGELLFWFKGNPADIPVFESGLDWNFDRLRAKHKWFAMAHGNAYTTYFGSGLDCSGIPCFSHYPAYRCADFKDIDQFEPLTVGTVIKWFGWFLLQLNNSYLSYK